MSQRIPALIASSLLVAALPSYGQSVDSKIHKLCIEAKDYAGCVKTMTKSPAENVQTIRTIEGEREATGNSCPTGYAYSGAGYCTNVLCTWDFGHDPDLGGKDWRCTGGILQKPSLRWGNSVVKAAVDSHCPSGQPGVGWQSTCKERQYSPLASPDGDAAERLRSNQSEIKRN